MSTLLDAHREWATRPDDERFVSLEDMRRQMAADRAQSIMGTQRNRAVVMHPIEDDESRRSIAIVGVEDGIVSAPSNWAFSQACQLVGAPASYLRTLTSDLASDCFNLSMSQRKTETVGFLQRGHSNGFAKLLAMTGPTYGRIWNAQIVDALISYFGTGPSAQFTVPGEFGQQVPITKANTTLFASDRDMFVFLADEKNRIDVPDRRGGQPGSLARGFFIRNSEVGASALRIGTFLFDYVCSNRIVWGAQNHQEVSIRHSAKAPDRWIDEVMPAIDQLSNDTTSMFAIEHALAQARARRLDDDEVEKILVKRFTVNQAKGIRLAYNRDEGRPMESVWDVVTGATAYARGLQHQDNRVDIERKAGEILAEVAR